MCLYMPCTVLINNIQKFNFTSSITCYVMRDIHARIIIASIKQMRLQYPGGRMLSYPRSNHDSD